MSAATFAFAGSRSSESASRRENHGIRLPPQAVRIEIRVHVGDALLHFRIERVEPQMICAESEKPFRLRLIRELVKPVTVGRSLVQP
jgi:hypothetical protein